MPEPTATDNPTTAPVVPTDPAPATPATGEPEAADNPLGPAGEAALGAERKARKEAEKQARDLAAKVKSFEDSQKTAEQKMAEDLAAAQARAAKAEADLLRVNVAGQVGFPANLVDLLTGDDEAAMKANAERIMAGFATSAGTPPAKPTRPVVSLQPGTGPAPSNEPKQITQAELDRMKPDQINAARAAGQLNTLLGVKPT